MGAEESIFQSSFLALGYHCTQTLTHSSFRSVGPDENSNGKIGLIRNKVHIQRQISCKKYSLALFPLTCVANNDDRILDVSQRGLAPIFSFSRCLSACHIFRRTDLASHEFWCCGDPAVFELISEWNGAGKLYFMSVSCLQNCCY